MLSTSVRGRLRRVSSTDSSTYSSQSMSSLGPSLGENCKHSESTKVATFFPLAPWGGGLEVLRRKSLFLIFHRRLTCYFYVITYHFKLHLLVGLMLSCRGHISTANSLWRNVCRWRRLAHLSVFVKSLPLGCFCVR